MPRNKDIKKVLVIGSGPIIIGQAAEFDYAGTQACRSLKEEGLEVVLLNSNPATIMTDKDIADRVYISSQNHGYVVDSDILEQKGIAKPAFVNVNDGTNEGMAYIGKNIFTVQFHPEACPGPQDSSYLFDRFMEMMGGTDHAEK